MNKELLRYFMAKFGDTNSDLAAVLDITSASLSAKLNEKGTEFKQGEIAKIKDRYNLSAEDIESIFFV